jgi:iron complex outermembrane recepter protein
VTPSNCSSLVHSAQRRVMTGQTTAQRARTAWAVGAASLLVVVVALVPLRATAQSTAAGDTLQEVVVTAQKRSESLQNVPMSITAITAETMQRADIQSFEDYAAKVPNLSFGYGQGQGVLESRAISIRGIQGADTTGFYIDDLPLPTTMDPRVVDLQRIEVLRGPQGTLYGARSMGGTVRLITTPPDPSAYGGQLHLEASSIDGGGNGYQTDGTLNAPLWGDRAAVRVTAYSGTDGGFINRAYADPASPSGFDVVRNVARTEFDGADVSLLWKVTDNFSVRPTFMYQLSTMNGLPNADISPGNLTEFRAFNIPENTRDRYTIAGLTMTYATPLGDFTSATSIFDRQAFEVEDVSEYVSGAFGLPLIRDPILSWNSRHSFTEEMRFASHDLGPFQFVGGLYYSNQLFTFSNLDNIPGLNAASGGAFGTDLAIIGNVPERTKQKAVFGELTYHLTSQWSATFGGRYSWDDFSFTSTQGGIVAGGLPPVVTGAESDHGFTPKGAIKYAPNPNLDFYALASKGFRLGGAQVPPPPPFCGADYANFGITPAQLETFQGDSLWNYEIGAKSRMLDNRLTVNAAAFLIDWTNLQQTLRFSCGFSSLINSGKARTRGGELEISAVPIDNLTVSGGVGYTDAKILSPGALLTIPAAGSAVQQVAPWTGNLSVEYTHALGNGFRGVIRGDYSYTDHSFSASNDPENPRLRQSYELTNIRFGVLKDFWEAAAYVHNVGDRHANLGDAQSEAAEDPGRPRFFINPPRTYGLEFRLLF